MKLLRFLAIVGCLVLMPQAGWAQDVAQAQALLDRGDYAGALQLAEPLCRKANEPACNVVENTIIKSDLPTFDPARYVAIMSAACLEPTGAVMCANASIIASGASNEAPNYLDWNQVIAPGQRGCSQGNKIACHALSVAYSTRSSPHFNPLTSIPYSRTSCQANVISACFNLLMAVQELPDPGVATYSADYLLSIETSCRLGETRACADVPHARTLHERASRYGAANALHMLVIDNGLAEGNWGGSVIHAIEESRAPAVVEYAVGRVASAGEMAYVRRQDLPVIANMLGNSFAGQAARAELNRRTTLDAQVAQRSSGSTGTSSSTTGTTRAYTPPRSTPSRAQVCTESYTGGGSGVNGRGQRIVRCQ